MQEHRQPAPGILQGDLLGGGHDDHASHGYGLGQAELGIAGAWGEVDHHHIPFSPGHLVEKLADDPVQHRASPDHRLVLGDQQAHRHHRNPAGLDGGEHLAGPFPCHLRGAVGHAQHGGGVGTIDIRIEQAHPQAAGGQGAGEVDGHGAFAHPTFAATHGNHVLDPGNGLAFGHLAMTTSAMACSADRGGSSGLAHFDLNVDDPIKAE